MYFSTEVLPAVLSTEGSSCVYFRRRFFLPCTFAKSNEIYIVHRGSEKRYVEKKQRNDQKIIASLRFELMSYRRRHV